MVLSVPVKAGVMTFVFTEGASVYKFASGDISEDQFVRDSAKNCGTAIVTGTATYVAVVLGATPAGPVIIAISIGGVIIADIFFEHLLKEFETSAITMDDILGELPTELQKRTTAWSHAGYDCIFEHNEKQLSLFDDQTKTSPLEAPARNSVFDDSHKKSIFD